MKLRNRILSFVLPPTLIPFVLMALAVYYFVIRANRIQVEEQQNKVLSESIVSLRKEMEAARRDVALIASLPVVSDYLEAFSRPTGSVSLIETQTTELLATTTRTILESLFSQNAYYLDTALFERALRPLLANHDLATFLFDDRGIVFSQSLGGIAEERCLLEIDLAAEAKSALSTADLGVSNERLPSGSCEFSFFYLPADEFIRFIEPLSGENWFLGVLQPQAELSAQMRIFQVSFFGILITAVVAVFWTTRRYSTRVTVPLEQVVAATGEIARGEFDVCLGVKTGDEVEELARAISRMAMLAQIAIEEAVVALDLLGNPRDKAKAQKKIDDAQREADRAIKDIARWNYAHAVSRFNQAWKKAQQALQN